MKPQAKVSEHLFSLGLFTSAYDNPPKRCRAASLVFYFRFSQESLHRRAHAPGRCLGTHNETRGQRKSMVLLLYEYLVLITTYLLSH